MNGMEKKKHVMKGTKEIKGATGKHTLAEKRRRGVTFWNLYLQLETAIELILRFWSCTTKL